MSDFEPLTDQELAAMESLGDFDLGAHAEEGDGKRLRSMVFEIRLHRDAMAPHLLRSVTLYTDELGALRKRVAELRELIALPDTRLIEERWRALSDGERLTLMELCCRSCGALDPRCYCQRDPER